MSDPVFNQWKSENQLIAISFNGPSHIISIVEDAYSLSIIDRKKGIQVLLCKRIEDKDEFEKEVDNLSKYFNAKILREA